uniref:Small ribosomal subunit protein uS19c n=1 Tax=Gymnochlora stellata TaxID=67809 RepID=A0A140JZF6_GYMST|nr:30S ribosomal protein S19 [Gymnochlora stellata]BAU62483.1 30S ribosomal protein S19 [Gymnochlora stellata]
MSNILKTFKRIPFVSGKLLKKVKSSNRKKVVLTWSRSSTIVPMMIGNVIAVYNGNRHIPVFVTDRMIGHKFGEFSSTRTFKNHKV